MDYNALIFFTSLSFFLVLLGLMTRKTGLSTAFYTLSLLIFTILGLIFGSGETVTVMVYSGTEAVYLAMDLGLSNDHIAIIYLSLALLVFYIEL